MWITLSSPDGPDGPDGSVTLLEGYQLDSMVVYVYCQLAISLVAW